MIDALLFSVRDAIRDAGYGYDATSCEIMPSGKPKPNCGNFFVAVHPGAIQSTMDNALDERFAFSVTLTMRVTVPLDRIGDQLLTSELARQSGGGVGGLGLTGAPSGEPSFNARCEQLRAFLHMNWGILQDANDFLVAAEPEANVVYGFVEPARYRGMDVPTLHGGEWFGAVPEARDMGLVAELRFEDCRRLQALASFV